MHKVLLLGAGKIGRMIALVLAESGDYDVLVADADPTAAERMGRYGLTTIPLQADKPNQLLAAMQHRETVISALSFHHNPLIAEVALEAGCSYFDLTEDRETTACVRAISQHARGGQVFVPQCGLAPGFVSIVARHLTRQFDTLETVRLRVGALPQFPSNMLKYNLTWSTDGLINEYCNLCEAIHEGRRIEVLPLEGLEHFSLDGVRYEAFNTSGGLGTLCETLEGQTRELNYKTIRYPGHRDLIWLLVQELRLSGRRDLLKDILERAVPITFQDVVIVFCTVTGQRNGQFAQMSDARKIYQQERQGEIWSSIQVTTAAGLCAVLDLHVTGKLQLSGFVRQEQIDLEQFLNNRFGRPYCASLTPLFGNSLQEISDAAQLGS